MSDSSRYETSLTPTIYFFVDKQSDEVAARDPVKTFVRRSWHRSLYDPSPLFPAVQ